MRAVLVANGEIRDYELLKAYLRAGDAIICADGGLRHAEKLGLIPDLVIGDMDSVRELPQGIKTKVYPTHKDATDGQLVIEYAMEQGFSELLLLGFCGGRYDHFLTNLFLLAKTKGCDALMAEGGYEIRPARADNVISAPIGTNLSILPLSAELSGITTDGLEYPLFEETLFFGDSRGNSNVMTKTTCRIRIRGGIGLIVTSPAEDALN